MAKVSINIKEGTVQKDSDIVIGIDLGTTNSLVSYVKDGKTTVVKDSEGKNTLMPSIIHFGEEQKIVVGDKAKQVLAIDPANTIYSVKRLMGKSYDDVSDFQKYFGYKVIDEDTDSLVKINVGEKY